MKPSLENESRNLAQSWDRHDRAHLQQYLVSSVEDPRFNLQSILTRHFILTLLFPGEFEPLMGHELLFGTFGEWLFSAAKGNLQPDDWHAILHALDRCADNAEGIQLPHFLVRAFSAFPATIGQLCVPAYMRRAFSTLRDGAPITEVLRQEMGGVFEALWREQLARREAQSLAVAEGACGSANDYRFIERYGIARFLDYTGFDLSEKNIANARAMYPNVRFMPGNIFEVDLPARSVEAFVFHDLLEHLSVEGLEQAVAEICRVTRRTVCGGFFSIWEGPDHIVRPVDAYHWNKLSLARVDALFRTHQFVVRSVHIDSYVRRQFPQAEYHNPNAYTLFFDRVG